MGIFSYSVKDKEGKIVKGQLEADSNDKAVEYLHAQGNIVLSLKEEKRVSKIKISRKGKVKTDDLVIFSRQLTTLIESSIPIVGALEILYEQTEVPYFKQVIGTIVKDLKEGSSFAGAIAKYPNIFSELYVSMVEAAETSGNLPEILERLSVYLEKTNALRKKIIASLTYPAVVILMAIGITAFLIFKVVPTFEEIFTSLEGELPLPTQILIGIANLLRHNIIVILIISFVMSIGIKKYISTPKGKKKYHQFILKVPIVGEIIRKVSIAQFARTFSTLVRSGVTIITALDIVGKSSGNKVIEEAVSGAKDSVQQGVPISEPLEQSGIFPPMVTKMIAVGEKTGKLEAMLAKIAQFYEEQAEVIIASLTSLIEPLVIAFLGIIVGGIVIALFLPIIRITTIISGS